MRCETEHCDHRDVTSSVNCRFTLLKETLCQQVAISHTKVQYTLFRFVWLSNKCVLLHGNVNKNDTLALPLSEGVSVVFWCEHKHCVGCRNKEYEIK